MKIRKATTNDLDQLADLFNQYRVFYKKSSDIPAGKEFLGERMVNNESEIFVAINTENEFAGFVQLYPIFSSTRMKRLWLLNDLFVAQIIVGRAFLLASLKRLRNFVALLMLVGCYLRRQRQIQQGISFIHELSLFWRVILIFMCGI